MLLNDSYRDARLTSVTELCDKAATGQPMVLVNMTAADTLLREYLTALEGRNAVAIRAPRLLEIPFLKPNRLVGKAEIERAYRRIFASLDSIRFELVEVIADDRHAIAECRLEVARRGQEAEHYDIAVTAEADDNGLRRVSIYADTRNVRRWADETIL